MLRPAINYLDRICRLSHKAGIKSGSFLANLLGGQLIPDKTGQPFLSGYNYSQRRSVAGGSFPPQTSLERGGSIQHATIRYATLTTSIASPLPRRENISGWLAPQICRVGRCAVRNARGFSKGCFVLGFRSRCSDTPTPQKTQPDRYNCPATKSG